MKKIALLSLAVVALSAPAFAADDMKAAPAAPAATSATAALLPAAKKVELKDGSWAQVAANGTVKVSKDAGKTWTAAPDGTWEAKDGAKITTKGGKVVK